MKASAEAAVRGKAGRKRLLRAEEVSSWRNDNNATIKQCAVHFGVSVATIKRYCAEAAAIEQAEQQKNARAEERQRKFEEFLRRDEAREAAVLAALAAQRKLIKSVLDREGGPG